MNIFTKTLLISSGLSSIFAANTMEIHPTALRQGWGDTIITGVYPTQIESIKSGDTVDYRLSKVSDLESSNTVSVLSVLRDIREKVLRSPYNPSDITINLSENYITSSGFKELVDFLVDEENQSFASRIKTLDLSNNRLDAQARENVIRLLRKYVHLSIDLSINYIAPSELSGIEDSERTRTTIRTY